MRQKNYIVRLIILATCVISIAGQTAMAQGRSQNKKEKVEAMRIAYITKRLDLTPDEAKSFWPLYDTYRKDLATLRRNFYPKDDGSDPHLDADRQLEFEQKKLDLKKQYKPQFELALGKTKLNLLISAEEDFKRILMQTIRNRQQKHGGGWK